MGYIENEIQNMLELLAQKEKIFTAIMDCSPEGTLQSVKRSDNSRTYFHRVRVERNYSDGPGHQGPLSDSSEHPAYINRRTGITRDPHMIKALANKEYAGRMLQVIRYNIHVLKKAKASLKSMSPTDIYNSMKAVYRTLPPDWYDDINRLDRTLEAHTAWAEEPYEISDYKPWERKFETSRKIYVRTRSELSIIEKLYEYHLVPRYEQIIHIGAHSLAPDFTFLGSDGYEFYWEFCGMMDDPDYVDRFHWKRRIYESAGIVEWDNMINTFGTKDHFSINEVIHVIEDKIIPRVTQPEF